MSGYVYKGTIRDVEPAPVRDASTPGPKPVFDPAKCGTMPGYKQHLRYNTDPCGPCRAANAEHSAAYRARKPKTVRVLKPCGTHAAYNRHLKNGEAPCEECTVAHAAYQSTQRRDEAGRTRLTVKPLDPGSCGTYNGYRSHLRRGQTPCPPCAEARAVYYEAWKATQERSAEQVAA